MPDDYNPKPFTDAQRELFETVAKLNRSKPDDFAEADQWIGTKPLTGQEQYIAFRKDRLSKAAERRKRRDRSYGIELFRPETGHGIAKYHRDTWNRMPDDQRQQLLRDARNYHGHGLRCERQEHAERIREETPHRPLQPHELIDLKATRFICEDTPLVFDAMNPEQKALWSRRLLRVVWILTDTADLTTTKLDWLRDWKWGEHALEFLGNLPARKMRPVPRLWSRVATFDRELDAWERLTRTALRALDGVPTTEREASAPPKHAESPKSPPKLNETDRKAAKFIRENPKCKGDAVATEIHVTPEHFRSRIFPKLSKHGYYNSGDGYCPPKRAKKAMM